MYGLQGKSMVKLYNGMMVCTYNTKALVIYQIYQIEVMSLWHRQVASATSQPKYARVLQLGAGASSLVP